jgi:DNA-binding SARP family transcriptional activator
MGAHEPDVRDEMVSPRRKGCPELALFDGFDLRFGDEFRRPCVGEQRLVAALALRGRLPRSTAAGLLWPDAAESRAQGNLRTALWRLARICPRLVVVDGEHLALDRDVGIDVHRFLSWADRMIRGDPVDDPDVAAARAFRAELLPGWYENWVIAEREQLHQLRLHALEALAGGLARLGRHAVAIEMALAAIQIDPLRESAHRALIAVHLDEDNLSEAARHMRVFTRLLRDELGVAPSPRMIELVATRMPVHRSG